MADRNFQKKKRNDVKRKRKPVMLITAEGRNKTEKQDEDILKKSFDESIPEFKRFNIVENEIEKVA